MHQHRWEHWLEKRSRTMPIEIRELHIKAVVSTEQEKTAASKAQQQASDREALVAECVAQVLEILREKAER